MRTRLAALSLALLMSIGLAACAMDGDPSVDVSAQSADLSNAPPASAVTEAAPAAALDVATPDDDTCGPFEKYCPITDECIGKFMKCKELTCPSGFHTCGDYCERNGHVCM